MACKFPSDFLWGTATAGHQIEGHNSNSDWWQFEQEGKIYDGTKSGSSVDYWNRYEEDHQLMQDLNYKAFRLGIEWAKIEPEQGKYNKNAINRYKKILQSLKDKNIKICLTVYHWVLPLWVAKQGGWLNEKTLNWYTNYTKLIAEEFGEYPCLWVTINEPMVPATAGYVVGEFPPEKKSLNCYFKVVENLLCVHQRGYQTIHKIVKDAKVGIAQAYQWIEPWGSPHFKGLYEKFMTNIFKLGGFDAWDDAIVTGKLKFPLKKEICIPDLKGAYDYSGINYYFRMSPKFDATKKQQAFIDIDSMPPGIEKSQMGWQIYPEGFYKTIKRNWEKFHKPVYILENGIADDRDTQRPKYLISHIQQMHRAIKEGCDVKGYFQWSFIDNFEWRKGFAMKFGLIECDYADPNLMRKPRKSAYLYSEIIKTNAITDEIIKKYT